MRRPFSVVKEAIDDVENCPEVVGLRALLRFLEARRMPVESFRAKLTLSVYQVVKRHIAKFVPPKLKQVDESQGVVNFIMLYPALPRVLALLVMVSRCALSTDQDLFPASLMKRLLKLGYLWRTG